MPIIAVIALFTSVAAAVPASPASPQGQQTENVRGLYRVCLGKAQKALYRPDLASKSIYPLLEIADAAVFPAIAQRCAVARADMLRVVADPAAAEAAMAMEDSLAAAVVTRNATTNRPGLARLADAIKAPGPRPAVRIASPEVTPDDYPNAAMRNRESGTAVATFVIGADGRAAQCTATGTSDTLNAAACRLIEDRSRFAPAIDAAGTPVADRGTLSIAFNIP